MDKVRVASEKEKAKIREAVKAVTPSIFAAATALYRGVKAMERGVAPTHSADQFIETLVNGIVEVYESGVLD